MEPVNGTQAVMLDSLDPAPEVRSDAGFDPASERLTGKIALVTGAGSPNGIGYATARRLAALGAEVAIVSTTRRIHERAGELGVTGFVADLTLEEEVGALADALAEQIGAARHRRQQRRPGQQGEPGGAAPGRRAEHGRVAHRDRPQPDHRVPGQPRVRRRHGRAGLGPDRQPRRHRRPGQRAADRGGVRGGQGRRGRADPGARDGAGRRRRDRQRGRARASSTPPRRPWSEIRQGLGTPIGRPGLPDEVAAADRVPVLARARRTSPARCSSSTAATACGRRNYR